MWGRPVPSLPSCPQYFSDAADAASWLREQHSALESASRGRDQTAAEALLLRHQRLECSLHAFGMELRRLDEQARAAATQVSLTVRVARQGPRTTGLQHQMHMWSEHYAPSPVTTHRGWKWKGFCGP